MCGLRAGIGARLAELERRAAQARAAAGPRVVVYLPRKDRDDRPPARERRPGGVTVVWYRRGEPVPDPDALG